MFYMMGGEFQPESCRNVFYGYAQIVMGACIQRLGLEPIDLSTPDRVNVAFEYVRPYVGEGNEYEKCRPIALEQFGYGGFTEELGANPGMVGLTLAEWADLSEVEAAGYISAAINATATSMGVAKGEFLRGLVADSLGVPRDSTDDEIQGAYGMLYYGSARCKCQDGGTDPMVEQCCIEQGKENVMNPDMTGAFCPGEGHTRFFDRIINLQTTINQASAY